MSFSYWYNRVILLLDWLLTFIGGTVCGRHDYILSERVFWNCSMLEFGNIWLPPNCRYLVDIELYSSICSSNCTNYHDPFCSYWDTPVLATPTPTPTPCPQQTTEKDYMVVATVVPTAVAVVAIVAVIITLGVCFSLRARHKWKWVGQLLSHE